MKRTFLLVSGLILSTLIFCQNKYYWQNPRPEGANLQGVFFINPFTGWMVGDGGTILHTSDGGSSWVTQNSGVTKTLREAFFIDENIGWVVGNVNTILHTADGGLSWDQQYAPNYPDLYSVSFINADTGWAFGSYKTILGTTDGGQNWQLLSQGSSNDYFTYYEGVFLNSTDGWVVGGNFMGNPGGKIMHSNDGGITWQEVYSTNVSLNSISFPDPDTGYVCGNNGRILKTTNGGQSWSVITTGLMQIDNLHVSFTDPEKGFLLLQGNGLYNVIRTSDGGMNWNTFEIGPPMQGFNKVFCTGESSAFFTGDNGLMMRTTDFGQNFEELCQGTHTTLNDICFTDFNNGWAAGCGYPSVVVHTVNSGQMWEEVSIPSFLYFFIIRGLRFYNDSEGIVVGDHGTIAKTSNAGVTWDTIPSQTTNILWRAGYFDRLHPVVIGWGGVVLTSSDSGNTWEKFQSTKNTTLTGLCILDSLHAYAVGYNVPQILYTGDRGGTWNEILTGTADGFYSVSFINQQEGWVGCGNGVVLHTADAGQTWNRHTITGGGSLIAIHFFNSMSGEAADMYTRYSTSNGGISWNAEGIPYNRMLTAAWYYDQHTAWFSGYGGTILLSSDSVTAVPEYKKQPQRLLLYPNPANKNITIEIPGMKSGGRISLMNLWGHELINDRFTGSGTVLDISGLPSGIYIVKVMSERTIQVGKMVKE